MIKNYYHNIFFFLLVSFLLAIYFVGPNNFFFNRVDWLYGSGDLTNAQLSLKYFLNDEWRFPLGKNPNYGLEISNSIIYTDNIPLLALFFKFFKPFLSENFQYFSIWIFVCFFLQLYIGNLLLNSVIKNNFYSSIASLFFLLCPFLLFRISHHFSLGAHWLILYAFHISYFIQSSKKNLHWYFLLFLSLMIHLYFTVIILIIYFCSNLKKILKKEKVIIELFEILKKILFCFFVMYVVGYFESTPINAVSSGYGVFKIDLLSFFDPKLDGQKISWSIFFKDLPGTSFEGFTYIGAANIFLIFLSLIIFLIKKFIIKNYQNNFSIFRYTNISIVIFLLWAITTNVSFMGKDVINLELPKYIFALLSIFSSTGRFAWPVIYLLIFFSLIVIYKNFNRTFSISIILFFLLFQFIDIYPGLSTYSFKNKNIIERKLDPIWKIIDKDYEILRTTYLFNNYGPIFSKTSLKLAKLNNIKTDIILNAAMDRDKAAKVRYELINLIDNGKLKNNTAYIVDNLGHLKQLKYQLINEDYGFFYRDNFWIILPGKKSLMNINDINKFKKIDFDIIKINKKYNLNFKDNFFGFGWSHNSGSKGAWSEGKNSFLLLKIPEITNKDLKLEITFSNYSKNLNKNYSFEIYVNDKFYKKVDILDKNKFKLLLKKQYNNENLFIKFKFNELISPYEIFESPDARKLGILIKSIIVK